MAKRKWGDRKDAALIRKTDSMHFIMGEIMPNRADNEAYISQTIDLTNANRYLAELNAGDPEFKYTLFHLIVTAIAHTIHQRPKLNRFYQNGNYYQRNEVTTAFVVKKQFSDNGDEGLAFLHISPEDNLESVHEAIRKVVYAERGHSKTGDKPAGNANSTEDNMDLFNKIPRFLSKTALKVVRMMDRHGLLPEAFTNSDPFQSSVVLSNLGSIKLNSGYHHLTNWGTTSIFCIVGEKRKAPVYDDDGQVTDNHEFVDLGLTVDERIADGYYFSRSVMLLKHLLEKPEELAKPMKEGIEFDTRSLR
ncbi:MAG: 2-oxo acid dehydrogenase subunit E2 [Firmicutes bacterium]|nr:2-oxo acid dehydrogenase subunit E2 [Bacillota bacterium]